MANNFDQVIQRSKGVKSPQERATMVLAAIEEELSSLGDDKNSRDELLNSVRSNRQKLVEAISGSSQQ
jgi:hypothetical protein